MTTKLSSPFPWVGGKRLLRDDIIARIPDHKTYIETFAGGAWVYWGKEPSKIEVINDLNGDLINLYRQIRLDATAFHDRLWWVLNARDEYYSILSIIKNKPDDLSDLDRAVYFFYVIKNAFGGRYGSGYAFSKRQPPRTAIPHETLVALSERLSNTYIENLSFERIIKNYDYPEAFFYCDPPFTCSDKTKEYQFTMNTEKHHLLHKKLAAIEGKFLLSYDDTPFIRDLYKDFKIEKSKLIHYSVNLKSENRHRNELYITNY